MRRTLSVLCASVFAAAACAPSAPTGVEPAPTATQEKPVPGGRLVIGSTGDAKTFMPVISSDTTSSQAWGFLYLSLTRANRDTGETEGNLALDAPKASADGLTLTYTLRDGLVWSDGTPFTGEDYKYTAEAVMRSKLTVRKSTLQDIVGAKDYSEGKADTITGIELSDGGKTITVKLTKVFCPAIAALGGAGAGGLLPKDHFVKHWDNKTTDITKNIDATPLNNAPPASMGPFIFKERTPGVQISYVKNPKFFRGEPLVDELVIKQYADTAATKAALLTGETSYGGVQASDYEEVSKSEILKGFRFPNYGYTYLGWNAKAAKAPWLADKRVRQALTHGIDRQAIMDRIVFGLGKVQHAHLPPPSWAYDDSVLTKYAFDPKKSKELLEAAGAKLGPDGIYRWTNGQPMQMRIETNSGNKTRETVLEVAIEQYKAIGVKIEPQLEAFNVLTDRTKPGTDFEGFILGWALGLDPDMFSIWHSSQRGPGQFNRVNYVNPEVDKALEIGRNGPDCSKAARKAQYDTVQRNLSADVPYTYLFSADDLLFANKQIQNFKPTTISTSWNIHEWWLKR